MFVIVATYKDTRRIIRRVDLRGDGSELRPGKPIRFSDLESAERFAAGMRKKFKDTAYTVEAES